MRTPLLCALAILCGAGLASAQMAPGYGYTGYGAGYPTAAGPSGYYGYSQYGQQMGYAPYSQGYPGYPNGYAYPNYAGGNQNYYYPTSVPRSYNSPSAPMNMSEQPSGTATVQDTGMGMGNTTVDPVPSPAIVEESPGEAGPLSDPAGQQPGWMPGKERFWVCTDYMMSYFRPEKVPPLVTIGSQGDTNNGTPGTLGGILGQPGTTVVVGGENFNFGMFSGARLETGFFLDDSNRYSLEAAGQYSMQNSLHFSKMSDSLGNPIIARPFFDVIAGTQGAEQDSNPVFGFAGGSTVDAVSQLYGGELNARWHFQPMERLHVDGLFGFRYLHLAESLTISDNITPLNDTTGLSFNGSPNNGLGQFVLPPQSLSDQDSFSTVNDYYGLQLGTRVGWNQDWFSVSAFGKVAMGVNDQTVNINGSTTLVSPGGNQVTEGGVLALPTNIGNHTKTTFSFVPEFGLNIGVTVTPWMQLTAGYSVLYWSQVVRPGDQIDTTLTRTQIPSDQQFGTTSLANGTTATGFPSRPIFNFVEDAFWMQNLTVGVNFHF